MEQAVAEKNIDIILDEANGVIKLTLQGFVRSKHYRETLNKALAVAKDYEINKWLTDIRKVKVISVADQEWLMADWIPRAVVGGYRFQALIIREDAFCRASYDELVSKIGGRSITAKNFKNVDDAYKWLDGC